MQGNSDCFLNTHIGSYPCSCGRVSRLLNHGVAVAEAYLSPALFAQESQNIDNPTSRLQSSRIYGKLMLIMLSAMGFDACLLSGHKSSQLFFDIHGYVNRKPSIIMLLLCIMNI